LIDETFFPRLVVARDTIVKDTLPLVINHIVTIFVFTLTLVTLLGAVQEEVGPYRDEDHTEHHDDDNDHFVL
jgi:hypothetical protein